MAMPGSLMVVDDHPDIRDIVSMVFESDGWTVASAEDGEECLELLREGFSGVIILDVMMPRLDGWGCLAKLEEEGHLKRARVVMLSALEEPKAQDRALPIDAYFTKPFNLKALQEAVSQSAQRLQG
jgi:CheY-like chemotaxis protein